MKNDLYESTCGARDQLYSTLGQVDPDVIAHIINPSFMGGPSWPALRQAFSVIHRGDSTMVISNGLADPFDDMDEINSGFGIEIYAETREQIGDAVSSSAVFNLVYAVSQQVAHSGRFADFIKQYGFITLELYADDCHLHDFQNEHGMVGVIIGMEHPEIPKFVQFPGGEVLLASVQILTPNELRYAAEYREEGRKALDKGFKETGSFHYISKNRKSLI